MHDQLKFLLDRFRKGEIGEAEILAALKWSTIQSLDFATIDHHRELRQGFPEVIFCEGKTAGQITDIAAKIFERHGRLLATRAKPEIFQEVKKALPDLEYNAPARCIHSPFPEISPDAKGKVAVISAGTSDIPVAEEAAATVRMFGFEAMKIYDVGVAGLHRLNHHWESIQKAQVLIVLAGMEGALASVVGGLVDKPVIAVPTSVGYGTSFGGLTALFAMLNSCASNVLVVNIDNGFGAGFSASLMLRQILNSE